MVRLSQQEMIPGAISRIMMERQKVQNDLELGKKGIHFFFFFKEGGREEGEGKETKESMNMRRREGKR